MNSVRDLSKDKDIIRIIGGMPDRVLDKDAESEGADDDSAVSVPRVAV